jgi:hypothetical protein
MKVIVKGHLPLVTINIPVPNISSFKSWKTTVVGLLSLTLGVVQASGDGSFAAAAHDFKVQIAFIGALIGFLSKDASVTGGTIPATPEAAVRVAAANVPQ